MGSRGAVVEWAKERMSQGEGVGGRVYGRSRGPLLLQSAAVEVLTVDVGSERGVCRLSLGP